MPLNTAQKEVVETASGPLLVLAGAGTGKTRVVTERTARLIQRGIRPERILAVTFTTKAAKEMQERITQRLGGNSPTHPEISTFHSLCVRILRRQIHHLGYPNQFQIYDRGDQEALARKIFRNIKSVNKIKPGDFISRVSQWKSAGIRSDQALNHLMEDAANDYIFAVAYGRYQKELAGLGAVDFDDLLLLTEDLFSRYPETLAEEAGRFDHLLVDEYQDTNLSQYRIVKGLAKDHRNLCVVGDDDQAIYGWRGAEVRHILNFKRDWPDAKIIRLETNYRSTEQILNWANRVIGFNLQRHKKILRSVVQGETPHIEWLKDGEEEALRVVSEIRKRLDENPKLHPRDFAILFRTNEQPRAFEFQLRDQRIPYSVLGGQSFFDKKEIKDIISYLKFFRSPNDEIALRRIINTPQRGIGLTTIQKLSEQATAKKISLWKAIGESEKESSFDQRTQKALSSFRTTILACSRLVHSAFTPENIRSLIEQIDYKKEIERIYPELPDQEMRWISVNEIVDAVGAFLKNCPTGTLGDFLDSSSLGEPVFSSEKEKKVASDTVSLMTYHAAKGLEFNEVYMVGMEEGILPHKRSLGEGEGESIDEERRLCYVGITRARKRLTLTMAVERMKWGKMRPSIPSRFLYEITGMENSELYSKIVSGETSEKNRF